MTVYDDLRAAAATIRALGPTITRIDLTPAGYDLLTKSIPTSWHEPPTPFAGTVSAVRIDVQIVRDLPAGACRFHWSDGRIVTRYRIIRHPSLIQFTIGRGPASEWWPGRGQMTYHGFAERWADDYGRLDR